MKVEPLSVTYARALFETAQADGNLPQALEEIELVAALIREHAEFRIFLEVPSIPVRLKVEALDRVFRGKLLDSVANFLEVVVTRRRQDQLLGIAAQLRDLYNREIGRVEAEAVTATPLGPDRTRELAEELRLRIPQVLGGARKMETFDIHNTVKPEILGGLIVRFEDWVLDASIQSQIETLSRRMLAQKPGSEFVHEN